MDVKSVSKDKEKNVFIISKCNHVFANTLRRYMTSEVPTLAVDTVEIQRNDSALYDQVVAHRLGLVPLTTDLKTYVLSEDATGASKKVRSEVKLTLKAKGPCTVLASEIKCEDPQVKAVQPEMPITKLLEGQEIEVAMTAKLGQGKEHAKHIPGLVIFRGLPELEVTKESNTKACVAELKDIITESSGKLKIKDYMKWNEACEDICESCGVVVNSSKEDFIFTIEPWGQLKAKEMIHAAIEAFEKKLTAFEKELKKIK